MLADRTWSVKLLVFFVLAASLAAAQAPRTGGATIEGRIVNPAPDTKIRLKIVRSTPLGRIDGYIGTVAADGSFRFDDIAPGSYRLIAEAPNYLRAEFGSSNPAAPGTVLHIKVGDRRTNLQLRFVPDPPVLCGRVVDAASHPIQATVEAFTVYETGDGFRTRPEVPAQITGADGKFAFTGLVDHDSYFLRANGVWYPRTRNYSEARRMEAAPASQSRCNAVIQAGGGDDCVRSQIHGTIPGKMAYPLPQYRASLYAANAAGELFLVDSHPLYRPDGFDFEVSCGGSYIAIVENGWANWQTLASPVFDMTQARTVVGTAVVQQNELVAFLKPQKLAKALGSLQVSVRFDGFEQKDACQTQVGPQVGVHFEEERNSLFAGPDKQGLFNFHELKPGNYTFEDENMAHGVAYLKSVTLDGSAVKGREFTLLPGQNAKLEVVYANNPAGAPGHLPAGLLTPHYLPPGTYPAASLSGKVTGAHEPGAPVVLRAIRFNSVSSLQYEAPVSMDGRFDFDAVDPGIYVLSTKQDGGDYFAYGAKGIEREGMPITLLAGQHERGLTVTIPAERASKEKDAGTGDQRIFPQTTEPEAKLAGELLIDGKAPDPELIKNWQPSLVRFQDRMPLTAKLRPDGHFSFDQLAEGDYNLFMSYAPSDRYLKSISLNGKLLDGGRIHLAKGESAVVVADMATDGASGVMTPGQTTPPIDPYEDVCVEFGVGGVGPVLLIPDPLPPDNSGIIMTEHLVPVVPPGRYRALAAGNFDLWMRGMLFRRNDLLEDHDFVERLAALGDPVVITPKERLNIVAPDRTADVQRVMAEMGIKREK